MSITRALIADAAMHGVTLTTETDDATPADAPGIIYAVDGPTPGRRAIHHDDSSAATDVRQRLDSLRDAADAAHQRAEQWSDIRRTASDDIAAWRELAAEVTNLLPDGCSIPSPADGDAYGLSGWPPMTAIVADALARWTAEARDRAARGRLAAALTAEGAELQDAAEQLERMPDYWQTVVELWQPVQVVRDPGDRPTVRGGRILTDTGTRRVIAWRYYGVAVAAGLESVDAAAEQLERARSVVAEAAQTHRDAADRLDSGLRL